MSVNFPSFFCLTACLLGLTTPASGQQPPELISKTTSLFDGKTLNGWDGDPRLWTVTNGVIRGETTEDLKANGNTFLIWKGGTVRDFDLRLSFRLSASNNSGIQYRSRHITEGSRLRNQWVVRGYQHELRNEEELPNVPGFIYDEGGRRGRIILAGQKGTWQGDNLTVDPSPLISKDEFRNLMKVDDWNDVVIRGEGRRIRHYLNGRLILDFIDSEQRALTEGILALQLHAGKPMWAEFRDIRLTNLTEPE